MFDYTSFECQLNVLESPLGRQDPFTPTEYAALAYDLVRERVEGQLWAARHEYGAEPSFDPCRNWRRIRRLAPRGPERAALDRTMQVLWDSAEERWDLEAGVEWEGRREAYIGRRVDALWVDLRDEAFGPQGVDALLDHPLALDALGVPLWRHCAWVWSHTHRRAPGQDAQAVWLLVTLQDALAWREANVRVGKRAEFVHENGDTRDARADQEYDGNPALRALHEGADTDAEFRRVAYALQRKGKAKRAAKALAEGKPLRKERGRKGARPTVKARGAARPQPPRRKVRPAALRPPSRRTTPKDLHAAVAFRLRFFERDAQTESLDYLAECAVLARWALHAESVTPPQRAATPEERAAAEQLLALAEQAGRQRAAHAA